MQKKLKYMQDEDEKSRASVNTNSYAGPIESNVVSTENTDNNIHPLLKHSVWGLVIKFS